MWVKIYGKEKSKEKGQEESGTKKESKAEEEGHKKEKQAMRCEDQSRKGVQEVCVGSRQILLVTQEINRLQSTIVSFLLSIPPAIFRDAIIPPSPSIGNLWHTK